jgi:hypothetical protein
MVKSLRKLLRVLAPGIILDGHNKGYIKGFIKHEAHGILAFSPTARSMDPEIQKKVNNLWFLENHVERDVSLTGDDVEFLKEFLPPYLQSFSFANLPTAGGQ